MNGMRPHRLLGDQFSPTVHARGGDVRARAARLGAGAYDCFIAPFAKKIKTAKMIARPARRTALRPFAALQNKETNHDLIDDYTLIYAPNASVLRFLRAKETPVTGAALILGNPASPLPGLDKLPGAEREATTIARVLATTAHLGVNARESLLYSLGGKVDLVHLAAHGLYDADILSSAASRSPPTMRRTEASPWRDPVFARPHRREPRRALRVSHGDRSAQRRRRVVDSREPCCTPERRPCFRRCGTSTTRHRWTDGRVLSPSRRGRARRRSAASAQLAGESEQFGDPRYWAAFILHGDPQGPGSADRQTVASGVFSIVRRSSCWRSFSPLHRGSCGSRTRSDSPRRSLDEHDRRPSAGAAVPVDGRRARGAKRGRESHRSPHRDRGIRFGSTCRRRVRIHFARLSPTSQSHRRPRARGPRTHERARRICGCEKALQRTPFGLGAPALDRGAHRRIPYVRSRTCRAYRERVQRFAASNFTLQGISVDVLLLDERNRACGASSPRRWR